MRLLLMADTHWPRRARDLPARVWDEVDRADVVVHAGDWVDVELLDRLLDRLERRRPAGAPGSARLVACAGNNDGPDLRARLPEVGRALLDGVRLAVVHETGPSTGRERRIDADPRFADTDVLVFGHSHIPWDSTTPRGLRLLNPGSPTDRRRQPECTYMTAEVSAGRLAEVRLHGVVPPRAHGVVPPRAHGVASRDGGAGGGAAGGGVASGGVASGGAVSGGAPGGGVASGGAPGGAPGGARRRA